MTLHIAPLAEALREGGYRTAFMGKWHLGTETYYYPEHQGFDVNVAGHGAGAPGSYLGTENFARRGGTWDVPGLEAWHGKEIYLTEALADLSTGTRSRLYDWIYDLWRQTTNLALVGSAGSEAVQRVLRNGIVRVNWLEPPGDVP
jgi:arylsulfatase A-like enzyme